MLKKETLRRAILEIKKIQWRQLYNAYLMNTNRIKPITRDRFKYMIAQLIIRYTNYRVSSFYKNTSFFSTYVILLMTTRNKELKEFVKTTNSSFFQIIQVTVSWDTKSGFMVKVETVFPYYYYDNTRENNDIDKKYAKDQLIKRSKYFSNKRLKK